MPVTNKKIRGKNRVVEAATGQIAKNAAGTPVDGGGHATARKARRQSAAINISLEKREAKK
jgi:hypothetical protein